MSLVMFANFRDSAHWGGIDDYGNRIPKYTKVKVLSIQDKHCVSWAASQSYAAAATAL